MHLNVRLKVHGWICCFCCRFERTLNNERRKKKKKKEKKDQAAVSQ